MSTFKLKSIVILFVFVLGLKGSFGQNWVVFNSSNSPLPNNFVETLAIQNNGKAWLGTRNGLASYFKGSWATYDTSNSQILGNGIQSVATDSPSDVWVGTMNGLSNYNGSSWNNFSASNSGVPSDDVRDIAVSNSGNVWVAAYGGGIAKYNGSNWTVYDTGNATFSSLRFRAIAIDQSGNIWVGTVLNGVYEFDGTQWTNYTKSNSGLVSDYIYDIAVDNNGKKWIATSGDGVGTFDGTWNKYTAANSGLGSNYLFTIAIDNKKGKWLGSQFSGLFNLDSSGAWTTYDSANSQLPSSRVPSIAIRNNGDKWFGTRGGGVVFTGDTCTPTASSINVTACNSYLSPSGKYQYSNSGIYLDTIPNAAGCDSIITINLTINNSSSAKISPEVCDSFSAPSGDTTWRQSGIYYDTLQNSANCDSVIEIDLTVNSPIKDSLNINACDSYTSPSGNSTWTTSDTYFDTISSSIGCDSIVYKIILTINSVDSSVTQNGAVLTANESGANYQWLDCNNGYNPISGETNQTLNASSRGSYAVEVTKNGCSDTSACYTVKKNTIKGSVTFNNAPLDKGKITLWESSGGNYKKVDSFSLQSSMNGQYAFNQVDSGNYIVKAKPDSSSSVAATATPTYHDSSILWQKADSIETQSGMVHKAPVYMVKARKKSGPGGVSGIVIQSGPGKRKGPGDPQGGVEVLALTGGQGNVQDFTYSNAKGEYEFSNMALDTYDIRVEIAGFTTRPEKVELTQDKNEADSVNFQVDKDKDTVYSYRFKRLNHAKGFEAFRVFPNPVDEKLEVEIKVEDPKTISVNLVNTMGKEVLKESKQAGTGINHFRLDASHLQSGVYFLHLKTREGEKMALEKIMVR